MREILFRGKRIDNKEWVKGDLVMVCDGETLKRYPCIVISYNNDTFDWHEIDPETLGQYLGIHDRCGARVFESDIVSISNSENETRTIIFNELGFGCDPIYEPMSLYELWVRDRIEVVGNIYDKEHLKE